MRVSIRSAKKNAPLRLFFNLNKEEIDYLFHKAEKISNRIKFFTKNSELYICRAESNEENSLAIVDNNLYQTSKTIIFSIAQVHYSTWHIGKIKECPAHTVEVKRILHNNTPHFVIPFKEIYKPKEIKDAPLFRPTENPPSEVRHVKLVQTNDKITSITIQDLKKAMDLVYGMSKELGVELFIDENGVLRAKIFQIL